MKDRYLTPTGVKTTWYTPGHESGQGYSVTSFPVAAWDIFTVDQDIVNGTRGAFHPHGFTKRAGRDYNGSILGGNATYSSGRSGDAVFTFNTSISPDGSVFSRLTNEAISQVNNQIRGQIDLAIDLLQARQTANMVRSAFKAVNWIKKIHPKNWSRNWLEYQYGWKPLIQTTFDLADQLINYRTNQYIKVRGYASENSMKTIIVRDGAMTGSVETRIIDSRYRSMIVAEFALSNSAIEQMAGFTSLNPASLAWECLPYSFVVDWFVDVGSYLRNLECSLLYGTALKVCYQVNGYRITSQGSLGGGFNDQYGNYGSCSARAFAEESYKRRFQTNLTPNLPSFKANLGASRLMSAASLLNEHRRR